MLHKRPELDTVNPPGQIVHRPEAYRPMRGLYLRDVIARIQAEDSVEPTVAVPVSLLQQVEDVLS